MAPNTTVANRLSWKIHYCVISQPGMDIKISISKYSQEPILGPNETAQYRDKIHRSFFQLGHISFMLDAVNVELRLGGFHLVHALIGVRREALRWNKAVNCSPMRSNITLLTRVISCS